MTELRPPDERSEIPSPEELGYKVLSDPYIDVTGFEYVRNDSAEITGVLQKAIFEIVLRTSMEGADEFVDSEFSWLTPDARGEISRGLQEHNRRDAVRDVVEQIRDDVLAGRYPVTNVCRGPSVRGVEDLEDEYDTPPIAARAGAFTHRFFDDVTIQGGDDVYYVYVKSTGYNHDGRKLPESSDVIGIVEGMDPPQSQIRCDCGHEWTENEFPIRIDECPECGSEDLDISGAYVDWDKIEEKGVTSKAEKILTHLGWDDLLDTLGDQDTFATF